MPFVQKEELYQGETAAANAKSFFKEKLQHGFKISGILGACRFKGRVHAELGKADVCCRNRELAQYDGTQSGAAGKSGAVAVILRGNTCLAAEKRNQRRSFGRGGIAAGRRMLDDNAAI